MNELSNIYSLNLIKHILNRIINYSDLEMKGGDEAREDAKYLISIIEKTEAYKNEPMYRWYVVNNQETNSMSIERLIDGYYSSAEAVYKDYPEFDPDKTEYCYMVKPIKESELPRRFV